MSDGDEPGVRRARIVDANAEPVVEDISPGPKASDPPRPVRLRRRGRWLVAAAVSAIAIGAMVGAGVLLTRPQSPEALAYVPPDSGIILEIRRDLPGDQRLHAGNLLAHLPGFKDQSILDEKIDEALTRLTRSISNGSVDFVRDLKPWLGGPLLVAARSAADLDVERYVLVATVDGPVDCVRALGSGTTRTVDHRGLALIEDARGARACAIDGRHALFGDAARVAAAVDARRDGSSMTSSAAYRDAASRLPADRLASVYATGSDALAEVGLLAPTLRSIAAGISAPAWAAVAIRAEDDALVLDAATAPLARGTIGGGSGGTPTATSGGGAASPVERAPVLGAALPASTDAVVEVHGAGIAVPAVLALLRDIPGVASAVDSADRDLAALGGISGLTDWVDDAALAVVPAVGGRGVGLLLHSTDPSVATAQVDQLRGILALAALTGRVTTSEATIDGVRVTSVDLGDASAILGGASPLPVPGVPAVPGGRLTLAFAARGGTAIVGIGEAFVRAVLDTQAGHSLAEDASFRRAIDRAGGAGTAQVFARGASAAELARSTFAADRAQWWTTEVRPYTDHLDAFALDFTLRGGSLGTRIVATVE